MNDTAQERIKKHGKIRTWFQAAWFVLTNGYIRGYTKGMIYTGPTKAVCLPGLNCYSCPGALGSCPMGSLQAVLGDSAYRVSLYVFGAIAAMGVVFGRLICSWMCPFGLFQDLLYKIKVKSKKKNLPGHRYLKYLRYVILIVFPLLLTSLMLDVTGTSMPWFCEWICPSGMLLGGIPLVIVNEGLRSAAGFRFAWKLFILLAVTVLSIWYYRPFCKYLCPLGAIYGLCNPISTYRLVIDKDKCVSCGSCQRACGMDIKTFETPNSPDCIRCGSCMQACPVGAIESTWGRTGRRLKARCITDDTQPAAIPAAQEISPSVTDEVPSGLIQQTGKATFLGVIMLIGSALSIFAAVFFGLFSGFSERLLVAELADKSPGDWLLECFWLAASIIIFMTGIYTLRNRRDPEKLLSVHEKTGVACILMLAGLAICIVCCIMDNETLALMVNYIFTGFWPLLGIPSVMALSRMLRRRILGQKQSTAGWIIMSVLAVLLVAAPYLIIAYSYRPS